MTDLSKSKCKPCEGGVAPYSAQQAKDMLRQLKGWSIEEAEKWLAPVLNYDPLAAARTVMNATRSRMWTMPTASSRVSS